MDSVKTGRDSSLKIQGDFAPRKIAELGADVTVELDVEDVLVYVQRPGDTFTTTLKMPPVGLATKRTYDIVVVGEGAAKGAVRVVDSGDALPAFDSSSSPGNLTAQGDSLSLCSNGRCYNLLGGTQT